MRRTSLRIAPVLLGFLVQLFLVGCSKDRVLNGIRESVAPETELTYARAQVETEIYALLTPQQKQQVAERREQMQTRRAEAMKRRQDRQ